MRWIPDGPVWLLVSHSYMGEFSASGIQRELDEEARDTTNISASWWSEDGKFSVRAYVNNLMDNDQYYSLGTGDAESNYAKTVGALSPRTMGVDLRYKF